MLTCSQDYVQGINDIATPFFVVFLSEFVGKLLPSLSISFAPFLCYISHNLVQIMSTVMILIT